jgi:hypothetical protein
LDGADLDQLNGGSGARRGTSLTAPQENDMDSSLQVTDAASEAVATHPRVRLIDIENAVAQRYDINAYALVQAMGLTPADELKPLSICILVLENGFTVIGKAAPASPENFNPELGKTFAYEDAARQLWPLMGFALRDRLHRDTADTAALDGATAGDQQGPAPVVPPNNPAAGEADAATEPKAAEPIDRSKRGYSGP